MAWRLSGQLIETCSCNLFCPCWFGVQEYMVMDQGWCATTLTYRIREGNADGLDLANRTVLCALDFPGPTLFDGNATARIYIDSGASADQVRELTAIYRGQKGGPPAALVPLITTWLSERSANMSISDEGDAITVTVGDAGTMASRRLRDGEGNGFKLTGGGFIGGFGLAEVDLAPSKGTHWTDPDLRQFDSKSGARGDFTWSA